MVKEKECNSSYLFHIAESGSALNIIRNGFAMKPLRCHDSFGGYSEMFGNKNLDGIYAAYFFDDIKTLSNNFTGTYKQVSIHNGKRHSVIFVHVQELKKAGFFICDDFYEPGKPITSFTMAISNKLKIIPGNIFRFLCNDSSVGRAPV
ncbi:hypothetical protein HAQ01_04970 [Acidithiobacillus thiooxidans]|uniref:DUF4433 domain-containing protein n=1 Tax=Acidithiobacillus sulfurivorans TaxID=1958756 RepID=A0ABS5ZV01_9PROT|nr:MULTISPECIES: hypothetical protein [Acidithiobacillus]MBU2759053.1 hypothetical protein [Acidithiobacillus sulfurivorans]MBU2792748.1 hypothetical protein [Acidithiobacillus thiooxidans]